MGVDAVHRPVIDRTQAQSALELAPRLFDTLQLLVSQRHTLVVCATLDTVRILDAATVLATHRRSFDRGCQVEDPAHIEDLEREKRLAREHRATDCLHHAAPSSKALFVAAAERNHHLGVLARGLIALLNSDLIASQVLAIELQRRTGVQVHATTVRRRLKRLGFGYRRARPTLCIRGPNKSQRLEAIADALAESGSDCEVFYATRPTSTSTRESALPGWPWGGSA